MNVTTEKKAIKGFMHRPGVHCASSALRNLFEFYGINLSEAMIFGLGAGLGIGYLKFPKQNPMIGGRRQKIEDQLGKALNIPFNGYRTKDASEGWLKLKKSLEDGQPQTINIDMFYLPYAKHELPSPDGEEFHFGQHVITVCGFDPENETVFVTDTHHEDILEVPIEDLTKGRNSSYNKWMDPYNFIYEYDFSNVNYDLKSAIRESIRFNGKDLLKNTRFMSLLGINGGTKGLEKFAKDIEKWIKLPDNELANRCEEIQGYISKYGTGGGFFRLLYSKFLKECSEIMEDQHLLELSKFYENLGNSWEQLSLKFTKLPSNDTKLSAIMEIQQNLEEIIELEKKGASMLANY